jgi:hypothetical protein
MTDILTLPPATVIITVFDVNTQSKETYEKLIDCRIVPLFIWPAGIKYVNGTAK